MYDVWVVLCVCVCVCVCARVCVCVCVWVGGCACVGVWVWFWCGVCVLLCVQVWECTCRCVWIWVVWWMRTYGICHMLLAPVCWIQLNPAYWYVRTKNLRLIGWLFLAVWVILGDSVESTWWICGSSRANWWLLAHPPLNVLWRICECLYLAAHEFADLLYGKSAK